MSHRTLPTFGMPGKIKIVVDAFAGYHPKTIGGRSITAATYGVELTVGETDFLCVWIACKQSLPACGTLIVVVIYKKDIQNFCQRFSGHCVLEPNFGCARYRIHQSRARLPLAGKMVDVWRIQWIWVPAEIHRCFIYVVGYSPMLTTRISRNTLTGLEFPLPSMHGLWIYKIDAAVALPLAWEYMYEILFPGSRSPVKIKICVIVATINIPAESSPALPGSII